MHIPCLIFVCSLTLSAHAMWQERETMQWKDINTREVVEWRGDTAILAHGSSMTELRCTILIDAKKVAQAIDMFGIPETWTKIKYRTEEELEEQQAQLKKKATEHGIKMNKEGDKFSVDYNWVVGKSTDDLYETANTIRSTARRKGYRSRREVIGAVASFVQELEYKLPPEYRINDEGEKILTAGATMPLETLANQRGDCDTKSLLFASLVRSIRMVDVILVGVEDHLFAGIQINPAQGDHKIRHQGRDWVLIELSDSWPIGHVPQNHLDVIRQGKYRIFDID